MNNSKYTASSSRYLIGIQSFEKLRNGGYL